MKTQWTEIRAQLEKELSFGDFKVWLAPLQGRVEYLDAQPRLFLSTKSNYVAAWIKEKLLSTIQRVSNTVVGTEVAIKIEVLAEQETSYTVEELATSLPTAPSVLATQAHEQALFPLEMVSTQSKQNEYYIQQMKNSHTFETFVVGSCNRLAHAAAQSIVHPNSPTEMLFLSSAPGLGKTHLTQALGKAMYHESTRKKLSMSYLTAEEFSSQFIQACRFKDVSSFKSRFKALDLLLLEDIHFLRDKEKTQEELLAIVNALQAKGGKVVFTSSFAPKEIRGLDVQLSSRFCSGFVASLEYPDYDTKKEMLVQKASLRNFTLPDHIADLFAEHLEGDVRLLESSLNNLILKAQTLDLPLTKDLAYSILAQVAPNNSELSLKELIMLVCSCYDINEAQLFSRSRKQDYVMARNTAFYLMRKYFPFTLQDIGSRFGRKHSTVSKAIVHVEEEMKRQSRLGSKLKHSIHAIESRATLLSA